MVYLILGGSYDRPYLVLTHTTSLLADQKMIILIMALTQTSIFFYRYGQQGYWPLNFNDMPGGLFTMFTLLYVNNMQVTASGIVAVTSTWSEVFFCMYYILGVLLFMNIFTAFVWSRVSKVLDENVGYYDNLDHEDEEGLLQGQDANNEPEERESSFSISFKIGSGFGDSSASDQTQVDIQGDESKTIAASAGSKTGRGRGNSWGSGDVVASRPKSASLVAGISSSNNSVSAGRKRTMTVGDGDLRSSTTRNSLNNMGGGEIFSASDVSTRESLLTLKRTLHYNDLTPISSQVLNNLRTSGKEYESSSGQRTSFVQRMLNTFSMIPSQDSIMRYSESVRNVNEGFYPGEQGETRGVQQGSGMRTPMKSMKASADHLADATIAKARQDSKAKEQKGDIGVSAEASQQRYARSKSVTFWETESEKRRARRASMRHWLRGKVDMAPEERAGVLMQYARRGEIHTLFATRTALYYFQLRSRISYPLLAASWIFTFLRIFQTPLWLLYKEPEFAMDAYPSGMLRHMHMSGQVLCAVKFPLLAFIMVGLVFEIIYKLDGMKRASFCGVSIVIRYALSAVTLANMIMLVIAATSSNHEGRLCQRLDWYLSTFSTMYIFWFDRNALRKLVIVLGCIPRLLLLLAFFTFFILVASASAMFIFNLTTLGSGTDDDYMPGGYYANYGQAVWETFVAVTSSSFPSQILPALAAYREFCLMAAIIIGIAAFIMLDICLAAVNSEFQKGVAIKERHEERAQSELLLSAFHILLDASSQMERKKHALGQSNRFAVSNVAYTNAAIVNQANMPSNSVSRAGSTDSYVDSNTKLANSTASPLHTPARSGNGVEQGSSAPRSPFESFPRLAAEDRNNRHLHPQVLENLWDELYDNYNDYRKGGVPDEPRRAIMLNIMDMDGDGAIGLDDFDYFLHVSRIHLKKLPEDWISTEERQVIRAEELRQYNRGFGEDGISPISSKPWYSRMYRYTKSKRIEVSEMILGSFMGKYILNMKKRYWDVLGDTIAGLLIILNILSIRDLRDETGHFRTLNRDLSVSLICFFFFEFIVKWLFLGIKVYFHTFRNRVDFLIFMCIFFILLVGGSSGALFYDGDLTHQTGFSASLEVIIIIRLLLYPRNIACFANPVGGISWDTILGTVGKLVFTFAEAFMCIGFTYAQVGCWFFGGTIVKKGVDSVLDRSPYGTADFYELNFNDMPTSFYTLFSCLRVSDFDTITSGFVQTTSVWARLYFVVWYIVGYMLLFNIVRSYFICVFQTRSRSKVAEILTDLQEQGEEGLVQGTVQSTGEDSSADAAEATSCSVQTEEKARLAQHSKMEDPGVLDSHDSVDANIDNNYTTSRERRRMSASRTSLHISEGEDGNPGGNSLGGGCPGANSQHAPPQGRKRARTKLRVQDEEKIAEELEPLEIQNLSHQFVIDLSALAGTPRFIAMEMHHHDDDHAGANRQTFSPSQDRHTNNNAGAESGVMHENLNQQQQQEKKASGSSYMYLATLSYVRDMDLVIRCDLLRRIKLLSDLSLEHSGRRKLRNKIDKGHIGGHHWAVEEDTSSTGSSASSGSNSSGKSPAKISGTNVKQIELEL